MGGRCIYYNKGHFVLGANHFGKIVYLQYFYV